jgi:hypothetical protein
MQLAQALQREPVEQGDKPQGEVVDRIGGHECSFFDAAATIAARSSRHGRSSASMNWLTSALCGARAQASIQRIQTGSVGLSGR